MGFEELAKKFSPTVKRIAYKLNGHYRSFNHDDLYQEATLMFELRDRFRILDYKLKTIQENLNILSNFVANRQHLLLEGTILALIVLEIILFGYQIFVH